MRYFLSFYMFFDDILTSLLIAISDYNALTFCCIFVKTMGYDIHTQLNPALHSNEKDIKCVARRCKLHLDEVLHRRTATRIPVDAACHSRRLHEQRESLVNFALAAQPHCNARCICILRKIYDRTNWIVCIAREA